MLAPSTACQAIVPCCIPLVAFFGELADLASMDIFNIKATRPTLVKMLCAFIVLPKGDTILAVVVQGHTVAVCAFIGVVGLIQVVCLMNMADSWVVGLEESVVGTMAD
eukprot:4091818-Ditylum_brightwellii.AAC.1